MTPGDSPEPLLQFFTYSHLPEPLQAISRPFCLLAEQMVADLERNPERTVMLRKLLEAKDCAVRAKIWKPFRSAEDPAAGFVPALGD